MRVRDAMAAAKRDRRFGRSQLNRTALRIDNRRRRGPDSLLGCLVSEPEESPSDIIRRAKSEILYWEDQQDSLNAIDLIKKHFNK